MDGRRRAQDVRVLAVRYIYMAGLGGQLAASLSEKRPGAFEVVV